MDKYELKHEENSVEYLYPTECLDKCNPIKDQIELKEIIKMFQKYKQQELFNDERIKIDTGFACNAKCYFCYYKSHLNDPYLELKEIKKQLTLAKRLNFKQIEYSGGESSYHPLWFNMLKIAKSMGFKISTVTNGIKYSDFEFAKKSKELGLEEYLFSVHGFKENHDKMVGVQGAFNKIIQAIDNAEKLNQLIRVNITVNLLNLEVIPDIVDLLLTKNVYQFNFIEINNSHEAYSTATKQHDKIYQMFKTLEPTFDKIIDKLQRDDCLNIRYLPFCKINEKYHKYNKNYIHHWIDKFDWHPMFVHRTDFIDKNFKRWKTMNIHSFAEQLQSTRKFWYYKDDNCMICEFNGECDGYKK